MIDLMEECRPELMIVRNPNPMLDQLHFSYRLAFAVYIFGFGCTCDRVVNHMSVVVIRFLDYQGHLKRRLCDIYERSQPHTENKMPRAGRRLQVTFFFF
jgi:hypothetical protein